MWIPTCIYSLKIPDEGYSLHRRDSIKFIFTQTQVTVHARVLRHFIQSTIIYKIIIRLRNDLGFISSPLIALCNCILLFLAIPRDTLIPNAAFLSIARDMEI